ncbi:MAG: hypothetical protein IJ816_02750 [Alloprevotella sp.]|nr:hypothetical protein [Alloprevotella sp.]
MKFHNTLLQRFKYHLCVGALLMIFTLSANPINAQSPAELNWVKKHKAYPYGFLSLQGGAQTTLAEGIGARKLFTPIASVSLGYQINPYIGLRANVSGWKNKGYLASLQQKYAYKYVNYDLDLLLNVSQFLASSNYKNTNVFLVGGLGINHGISNRQMRQWVASGQHTSTYPWRRHAFYNARVGVLVEHALTRHLAVNIEATANNVGDRYNSIANGHGDWQIQVLCGVSIRFGHKKNPHFDPNFGIEDTPELQFEEVSTALEETEAVEEVEEATADDDEEEEEASEEPALAN